MSPVIRYTTRTCAALVMAALPTVAFAQTPRAAAVQANPAAEHLAAARSALNKVLNAPAPTGDAFKKLAELKTEYVALERAASTASPEWSAHYAAIDRLVTGLIGAPAASAVAGAVGTTGRAGEPGRALDPAVVTNLQEFRTQLAAFSAVMSPAASTPPTSAPPAPVVAAEAAAPPTPPADETSVAAQVDQVAALVDGLLAASPQPPGATVSVDRATLEQIKAQLDQIKQRMKK